MTDHTIPRYSARSCLAPASAIAFAIRLATTSQSRERVEKSKSKSKRSSGYVSAKPKLCNVREKLDLGASRC